MKRLFLVLLITPALCFAPGLIQQQAQNIEYPNLNEDLAAVAQAYNQEDREALIIFRASTCLAVSRSARHFIELLDRREQENNNLVPRRLFFGN